MRHELDMPRGLQQGQQLKLDTKAAKKFENCDDLSR
jgi:hypothetical protein